MGSRQLFRLLADSGLGDPPDDFDLSGGLGVIRKAHRFASTMGLSPESCCYRVPDNINSGLALPQTLRREDEDLALEKAFLASLVALEKAFLAVLARETWGAWVAGRN